MSVLLVKLLSVLGYEHDCDPKDKRQLMQCVCWLEDRKIRELEIAEREALRSPGDFEAFYSTYLERLGCPFEYDASNPLETLSWLVSNAISVEYEDCSESCINLESGMEIEGEGVGSSGTGDVENAKLQWEQLDIEVEKLGSLLQMSRLPSEDTADYIGRLNKFIHTVLTPSVRGEMGGSNEKMMNVSLDQFSPGLDSKDDLINQMSTVLKMLYLWDLRDLQTDLNALVALGQTYTADPKTNTSLGKVGR